MIITFTKRTPLIGLVLLNIWITLADCVVIAYEGGWEQEEAYSSKLPTHTKHLEHTQKTPEAEVSDLENPSFPSSSSSSNTEKSLSDSNGRSMETEFSYSKYLNQYNLHDVMEIRDDIEDNIWYSPIVNYTTLPVLSIFSDLYVIYQESECLSVGGTYRSLVYTSSWLFSYGFNNSDCDRTGLLYTSAMINVQQLPKPMTLPVLSYMPVTTPVTENYCEENDIDFGPIMEGYFPFPMPNYRNLKIQTLQFITKYPNGRRKCSTNFGFITMCQGAVTCFRYGEGLINFWSTAVVNRTSYSNADINGLTITESLTGSIRFKLRPLFTSFAVLHDMKLTSQSGDSTWKFFTPTYTRYNFTRSSPEELQTQMQVGPPTYTLYNYEEFNNDTYYSPVSATQEYTYVEAWSIRDDRQYRYRQGVPERISDDQYIYGMYIFPKRFALFTAEIPDFNLATNVGGGADTISVSSTFIETYVSWTPVETNPPEAIDECDFMNIDYSKRFNNMNIPVPRHHFILSSFGHYYTAYQNFYRTEYPNGAIKCSSYLYDFYTAATWRYPGGGNYWNYYASEPSTSTMSDGVKITLAQQFFSIYLESSTVSFPPPSLMGLTSSVDASSEFQSRPPTVVETITIPKRTFTNTVTVTNYVNSGQKFDNVIIELN